MRDYDFETRLKNTIEEFWRARGFRPRVFLDTLKNMCGNNANIYCIRSDMIGGKPTGAPDADLSPTQRKNYNAFTQQWRRGRKTKVVRPAHRAP